MRRNHLSWILIAFWSLLWMIHLFFSLTKDESLSWQNSIKDIDQPVSAFAKYIIKRKQSQNSSIPVKLNGLRTKRTEEIYESKDNLSDVDKHFLQNYGKKFQSDWCRMKEAKMDWASYLAPCFAHTKWDIKTAGWKNELLRTSIEYSYISKWDIRPTGEFSRFFIQSRTADNQRKKIGGDSWRIHVKGSSSAVSATVFDHNNGVYEVLFLLMEEGSYNVQIYLDYTLCDGLKDPPADWYRKGGYQGKNQPDGILMGDRPYLMAPLHGEEAIRINVTKPAFSREVLAAAEKMRNEIFQKNSCAVKCPKSLTNGEGRWINGTWKPFSHELGSLQQNPRRGKGILWIYGDSVSKSFAEYLVTGPYHEICGSIFNECKITYSWVYNMRNIEVDKEVDGRDYSHELVMEEINKVLNDERFDKHGVLLLNWGIHFAAAVNFSNYKQLVDEFVEQLRLKQQKGQFKGRVIWRTTSAIFRERFPYPNKDVRRFLTFPRIILYNAYAMSAMCAAGVEVLDVYAMTDSFPPGTVSKHDPVHFARQAMEYAQAILYHKSWPHVN